MKTLPSKSQIREYLISNAIDHMVQYLIEDENISLEQAIDRVYTSRTIQLLQIPQGELYVQSPAYIYELLKIEK